MDTPRFDADIESAAYEMADDRNPTNQFLQSSIAISLKRIADTLECMLIDQQERAAQ